MATLKQRFQLVIGSTVLSAGLAVAALAASHENFFGVLIGFSLFIMGYELSQYSAFTADEARTRAFAEDLLQDAALRDLFMAIVGIGTIAYGFTLLFRSIEEVRVILALLSAFILAGGYMLAHYAINHTVI